VNPLVNNMNSHQFGWNTYDYTQVTVETLKAQQKAILNKASPVWIQRGINTWVRAPRNAEISQFIQFVTEKKTSVAVASYDKEDLLCRTVGSVEWEGTCLTIDEKKVEMDPVPYVSDKVLSEPEKAVVGFMSMNYSAVSEKGLVMCQQTSAIKAGALSNVMDVRGFLDFTVQLESEVVDAVEPTANIALGQQLARWYVAKPRTERMEMAKNLYLGVFRKTFQEKQAAMQVNPVVKCTVKTFKVGDVKYTLPVEIKTGAEIQMPEKKKKAKSEDLSTELQRMVNSFPQMLVKFAGYRGTPGKLQRWMLPLMTVAKGQKDEYHVYAPNEQEKKWLDANEIPYVEDREEKDETLIVRCSTMKDAGKWIPKGHLVYGNLPIQDALQAGWTAVAYRLEGNLTFFWYKGTKEWTANRYGYGKKVLTSAEMFRSAYQSWVATMLTCYVNGSYKPKTQWYEELKYPDLTVSLSVVRIIPEVIDLESPPPKSVVKKKEGVQSELVMPKEEIVFNDEEVPEKSIPRRVEGEKIFKQSAAFPIKNDERLYKNEGLTGVRKKLKEANLYAGMKAETVYTLPDVHYQEGVQELGAYYVDLCEWKGTQYIRVGEGNQWAEVTCVRYEAEVEEDEELDEDSGGDTGHLHGEIVLDDV